MAKSSVGGQTRLEGVNKMPPRLTLAIREHRMARDNSAPWEDFTSCQPGDLEDFFLPEMEADMAALCKTCVVRPECFVRAVALRPKEGIWAGFRASTIFKFTGSLRSENTKKGVA